MSSSNITEKLELVGIKLKNYRSCRIFPENGEYLKVGKFTTLIGKNDVGKSNVLRAIYVACKNQSLSTEDFHKGIRKECEISLLFRVPETLKGELKRDVRQYHGDYEIEIKTVFQPSEKPKKGAYFLGNGKITYRTLEKHLPYVLLIPAVKSVEDELKFGRNTITSELFLPIIEKTSEEKAQTESVSTLKRKLKDAIQRETEAIRSSLKRELSKMWDEIEDVVIDIPELKLEKAFNPEIKIKDKYLRKEISIVHRGSGMQRHLILAMLEIYRQLKIW